MGRMSEARPCQGNMVRLVMGGGSALLEGATRVEPNVMGTCSTRSFFFVLQLPFYITRMHLS